MVTFEYTKRSAAMKRTFTVPEVPGSRRSSDSRVYTHALIGRFDHDAQIKRYLENRAEAELRFRSNWHYHHKQAITLPGEKYWHEGNGVQWYSIQNPADHAKGVAFVAAHPDVEAYVVACFEETLARYEEAKARAADRYVVLQWSMSERNATKALGSFHNYKDLWVAAVVEVVKKRRPHTLGRETVQ